MATKKKSDRTFEIIANENGEYQVTPPPGMWATIKKNGVGDFTLSWGELTDNVLNDAKIEIKVYK